MFCDCYIGELNFCFSFSFGNVIDDRIIRLGFLSSEVFGLYYSECVFPIRNRVLSDKSLIMLCNRKTLDRIP